MRARTWPASSRTSTGLDASRTTLRRLGGQHDVGHASPPLCPVYSKRGIGCEPPVAGKANPAKTSLPWSVCSHSPASAGIPAGCSGRGDSDSSSVDAAEMVVRPRLGRKQENRIVGNGPLPLTSMTRASPCARWAIWCQAWALRVMAPATPWLSMRDAVLTVSPHRSYRYCRSPITPATTGPKWMPTRRSHCAGRHRATSIISRAKQTQFKTGFSTWSSRPAAAMKASPMVLIFCTRCSRAHCSHA